MDLANLNYNDFFLRGFTTGEFWKDVSYFKKYDIKNAEDPNVGEACSVPKDAEKELQKLQREIGEKLISNVFAKWECRNVGAWEGVDEGSVVWHNDQMDGKNMNSNVIIYLDDTREHNNNIQVKNQIEEFVITPKENDFIWLNQNNLFRHKASHNDGRRRILSFEYYIDGLDN